MDTSGIDMNNPTNLSYYSQIIVFKNSIFEHELLFDSPDNSQRRTLHDFADGFGLEYEYSRATRQVRITRPEDLDAATPAWRDGSMFTSSIALKEAIDSGASNGWQSSGFDATSLTDPATLNMWLDGYPTSAQGAQFDTTECLTPRSAVSIERNGFASKSPVDTALTSLHSGGEPGKIASTSPSYVTPEHNATASSIQGFENDDPPRGRSRQATTSPIRPTLNTSSSRPDAGFGYPRSSAPSFPITGPNYLGMNNRPSSVAILAPTPRKVLTDDDRRRMCIYHEENPSIKQTEIGAMFGVERSTVSKVLRQKAKYLEPEEQNPRASNYPKKLKRRGSINYGRESPGTRGFRSPSSPASETNLSPFSDQAGIFHSQPSSPVGRYYSSSPSSPSRRMSSPSGLSPARSGPLDYHVQTKMRAVKAGGGACWRCRLLKKSCDPETPCVTCSNTDTRSNWGLVGCKRGGLQAHMPSLDLCPHKGQRFDLNSWLYPDEYGPGPPNRIWSEISDERNTYLKSGKMDPDCSVAMFLADLEPSEPLIRGLRVLDTVDESSAGLGPSTSEYLDKSILAIMWSILECSSAKTLLEASLRDIGILSHSAAQYYVRGNHINANGIRNDQLIYNSIACLRVALEAMQVGSLAVTQQTHRSCTRDTECKVQCISKITSWVDIYVTELTRVMFLKENMIQKSLWLSTFYSLCIQSYVRKVLANLSDLAGPVDLKTHSRTLRFEQYLHLGIRLFTAASGDYDPLMEDYSLTPENSETDQRADANHYRTAQLAVQQFTWENEGISGSYDYLKRIFEDSGETLEGDLNSGPNYATSFLESSSTLASEDFNSHEISDLMQVDQLPKVGGFLCQYPGCTAQPFQTQYLLNSHAAVHSSDRPYYCPVVACPRSEGGKGFKRKNEMIRHGLVHDCPGYICPFCPDREHKYPRPDNLQRHVRVHHPEKDKDDPELKKILSQKPDGPNRGRRRRLGRMSQESSNMTQEGETNEEIQMNENMQGMASMTQPSNRPLVSDTMPGSDPFGLASSMELERTPTLDRTTIDIWADEVYDPSFQITSTTPGQTATTQTSLPPQNDIFSQRLRAANAQHLASSKPHRP